MRTPVEPHVGLRRVEPTPTAAGRNSDGPLGGGDAAAGPEGRWVSADRVFGLAWSGRMTEARIAGLIREPPARLHRNLHPPGDVGGFRRRGQSYAYADELAALLSSRCHEAIRNSAATVGGYADIVGAA